MSENNFQESLIILRERIMNLLDRMDDNMDNLENINNLYSITDANIFSYDFSVHSLNPVDSNDSKELNDWNFPNKNILEPQNYKKIKNIF